MVQVVGARSFATPQRLYVVFWMRDEGKGQWKSRDPLTLTECITHSSGADRTTPCSLISAEQGQIEEKLNGRILDGIHLSHTSGAHRTTPGLIDICRIGSV